MESNEEYNSKPKPDNGRDNMFTEFSEEYKSQSSPFLSLEASMPSHVSASADFQSNYQDPQLKSPDFVIDPEDGDVIDFLFSQESELGLVGILPNIEDILLNMEEFPFVYSRLAKLFNFISSRLEAYMNQNDPSDSQNSLEGLTPYIRLLLDTYDVTRFTQLSFFCVKPPGKIRLTMSPSFLQDFLYMASKNLHEISAMYPALLQFFEFAIAPAEAFTLSINKPYQQVFAHFLQNIYEKPSKELFKFLSQVFMFLPHNLIPRFCEDLLLPTLVILESGIEETAKSLNKEDKQGIMEIIDDWEAEQEEMFIQIAKLLTVVQVNPQVKETLFVENTLQRLYNLLREAHNLGISNKKLKISLRCSLIMIQTIVCQLQGTEKRVKEEFAQDIYKDIIQSLEKPNSKFLSNVVFPLLSAPALNVIPVCLHIDEEPEAMLNSLRSNKNPSMASSKVFQPESTNQKLLSSTLLSSQEKNTILSTIQKVCFSNTKKKNLGAPGVHSLQWKRCLHIDFENAFGGNPTDIKQVLAKTDGVLMVFHCLLGQDIAKIGVYCNTKLTQNNLADTYSTQYGGLRAYQDPENFLFYYSDIEKLHFPTCKQQVDFSFSSEANIKTSSKAKAQPASQKINIPSFSEDLIFDELPYMQEEYYGNSSKAKQKIKQPKPIKQPKVPCVEYSDHRIALYYDGKPILEYFPSAPDTSKVEFQVSAMQSFEELNGKTVLTQSLDSYSIAFVQGVEIWTADGPEEGQKQEQTQDFIIQEMNNATKSAFYDIIKTVRTESPVYLMQRGTTFAEFFTVLLKGNTNLLSKIELRNALTGTLALTMKVEELLNMYDRSDFPQILDVFVSSTSSAWALANELTSPEVMCENLLKRDDRNTEDDLVKYLMTKERAKTLLWKAVTSMDRGNSATSRGFKDLLDEMQVFWSMQMYEDMLAEDQEFFGLVLSMLGNTKNKQVLLKLNQRAYSLLEKVFNMKDMAFIIDLDLEKFITMLLKKLKSLDKEADKDGIATIEREVNTGSKPEKPTGKKLPHLFSSIKNPPSYKPLLNNFFGGEESKANDDLMQSKEEGLDLNNNIVGQLQNSVITSLVRIMEIELPEEVYEKSLKQIKEEKIMTTILRFLKINSIIGAQNEENGKLQTEILTLLELWSKNDHLSELFWEELEGYELVGQEQQKIPIYQRFMELIEQSNAKSDFKNKKGKQKKSFDYSTNILEAINANLHKIYDINVIEKTTDISNDLALPLAQSYPKCLKPYCVDSSNILNNQEVRAHHYRNSFSNSNNPSSAKVTRITKELSDLASSLPISATNAILVRYDQSRMDVVKIMIFGSAETPYAHGAFEYDMYIGDDYPNNPPQVNLMTTGNGTIRFNPNLYACGKVCLSLLGTWRGNGNENWKPNMSTILQVLISIQSIIMTEDVYYNEPGFEGSKSSVEGKRLNNGYSNIVKYANVKFAMVEALKNPPASFKEPVLIHFYLKKYMIMEELNKWLADSKHPNALYTGLVQSHNSNLAHRFQQSNDGYHGMLNEAINELGELLDNLNLRIEKTFKIRTVEWKRKKPRKEAKPIIQEQEMSFVDIKQIDVEYDEKAHHKQIDLNDEKVTNRWSRYIGAMGLEAVEKQANSCVLLIGLNAVGVEIAKNVVLSGVKKFSVCDWKKVEVSDLAGQFFLTEKDIGKNRAEASLNKLQALNQYVQLNIMKEKLTADNLKKQLGNLASYNVLVCCEGDLDLQISLGDYCRSKGVLFISATVRGLFSRVFCDFGENFLVVDKTGEEQQEFVVREVTPEGTVSLLEGVKHGLQDNDKIVFIKAEEEDGEGKSFTETTHSIIVKDKNSFSIGDISGYKQIKSGIIKSLKKQETLSFKPFSETLESPPLDYSISGVDFLAQHKYQLLHVMFLAIERYVLDALKDSKTSQAIFKRPVDIEITDGILRDSLEEIRRVAPETLDALRDFKELAECLTWVNGLVDTYHGVFPPLCAFIGGIVSQEIIKGITRKYTPIKQYFYYECSELYESNRKPSELMENGAIDKYEQLKVCIGEELFGKLRDTKLFMVGAGAIGCELLKNYAMLGLASNKGKIVLTDPDVIESSNLNRQFLFREKHIRKPKAATAAAVAIQMNPDLHDKVLPMLEKVHEGTENIFTEKFFEELDVVTNALDNIQARKYVDNRCVKARTPLLESGTLGPKGHVQVIIPFKTESYGSQQDPQEDNEIPYCTLKMFPEETLHCIEWARDKFTRMYSQKPSSFVKATETFTSGKMETLDEKILKEAVKFGQSFPKKFEDCVQWALNKFYKLFIHDIKQLLYTYPLDFKTADGQLFWSLPKRTPHPMSFDSTNPSHVAFIAACACLRARVCGIEPPKNARKDKVKKDIAMMAAKMKPKAYKISDEKAKELKKQNDKGDKTEKMVVEEDIPQEEEKMDKMEFETFGKEEMIVEIVGIFKTGAAKKDKYNCNPQEFEKDEDENFHIDFLHAMTNCRAENYGLANMDWLNVKLKAGRIVPALATTTAAIAGLQTIELCKLLAKCRIEQHKNSFLNFSIPILAQSEPMNAPEFQLGPNLKVNMWDRWEVDLTKKKDIKSIGDLFKDLEKTTGLQPLDLLRGNTPIYLYQLMELPGKNKEKEMILNKNLEDLLQYNGQKYVDLTITFTSDEAKLKNPKDITIKGTPPIRIYYNAGIFI